MQHNAEQKKMTVVDRVRGSKSFLSIVGLVAAIVIGHSVFAAIPPQPMQQPLPLPPILLTGSNTSQAKAGWLGLGIPSQGLPTSVVDVRGTIISDVLGILGNANISEKLHIGGTTPSVGSTDPTFFVEGSRIKSLVLAGTGERNLCADSDGRLVICGPVTPPTPIDGVCGTAAQQGQGAGQGYVTPFGEAPNGFNWGNPANPYLCATGTPILPVQQHGGTQAVPPDGGWTRVYDTWVCAGINGGQPSETCMTETSCPPEATGSFLPGTMVTLADGSKKAIETITTKDKVLTANSVVNNVIRPFNHPYEGWVYGINGSKPFVTANHPMMTPDGWKAFDQKLARKSDPELTIVSNLQVGDYLINESGKKVKITSLNRVWMNTTVYNLNVSGNDEYFAESFHVHNAQDSGNDCEAPTHTPPPPPPPNNGPICEYNGWSAGNNAGGTPHCNIDGVVGALSVTSSIFPRNQAFIDNYCPQGANFEWWCYITMSNVNINGIHEVRPVSCTDVCAP